MPMPKGNIYWKHVLPTMRVIEHPTFFEVVDGRKRYVANWGSSDAREAQGWLKELSKSRRSR